MPDLLTTTNNAFRYPTASNDGVDFDTGLADFASDVDGMWRAGTLASRPASARTGAIYYATDTGQIALSDGTKWNPLNLPVTFSGTNTTVAVGMHTRMTAGSTTATLPSPTAGAVIGIQAGVGASGSSPITVNSPVNIVGVSVTATSFTLGTPWASVTLRGDGSTWWIVAGEQDTGWLNLVNNTLGASSAATGYYAPAIRLLGDMVYFRGAIQFTGSPGGSGLWSAPGGYSINSLSPGNGTLKANIRDTSFYWYQAGIGGTATAGQNLYLDGFFCSVS